MPGLVYTFVARGTTVLAEYAAISGNFKTVGIEVLQNAQMQEDKFVVTADQYTFNYFVQQGYTYLAVADEAYGRQIPFAFLERVADAFMEKFGEKGRTAAEGSLQASFSPVMQRQLTYCMEHPEEISKMASVQRKVDEVKSIMLQNVDQVLVRGERLDVLVDRTDDLRDQAHRFQKQGTQLRKRMWWQNFRVKLIVVGVVVLLVVVIFLLACFTNGRNCVKTGSSGGGSPNAAAAPALPGLNGADLSGTPSALVPGTPNLAPAAAPALPRLNGADLPGTPSALVPGTPDLAPAAAPALPRLNGADLPGTPSALVPGTPDLAPAAAPALPRLNGADLPGTPSALVPGTPNLAPAAPAASG